MAVVTPTDRPKSVYTCCVIEHFVALFVLSLCPFDISVGVGAFVIGLSKISSFLSYHKEMQRKCIIFIPLVKLDIYVLKDYHFIPLYRIIYEV